MFDDILGNPESKRDNYEGCPFCGSTSIEEDGPGLFPSAKQFNQPMVCSVCEGKWTIEYDEDLKAKNVDF